MKIIEDTLKTNGKWSRKSLTMLVSFTLGCFLTIYIVISDYFLKKEINSSAIIAVGYLFAMATGQALIISKDKRAAIENNAEEELP